MGLRKALFLFIVFWGISLNAHAIEFVSGSKQVGVLELYTSEGCSSCPPADAWVSQLKKQPDLWGRFVALGFHVNYWDYLGWRDRFSKEEYVGRQKRYVAAWNTGALYTPGIVLNGKPWKGWRGTEALPHFERPNVGSLHIKSNNKRDFSFTFQPSPEVQGEEYEAFFTVIGFDLISDVRAGENHGKQLKHDFVVLEMRRAKMHESSSANFSSDFTSDLEHYKEQYGQIGIVGWVSYLNVPTPLQATGGPVSS